MFFAWINLHKEALKSRAIIIALFIFQNVIGPSIKIKENKSLICRWDAFLLTEKLSPFLHHLCVGTYMPYGYNSTSGQVEGSPAGFKGACLICEAGHFCLNGTVLPYPCGKGKYTNPGQSVCQQCLAGRYCDSETTTETAMNTTKLCPAGQYCTVGLKDVSEATNCSKAHYCPEGM